MGQIGKENKAEECFFCTCIALASDVEIPIDELRVQGEKAEKKGVGVRSRTFVAYCIVGRIREEAEANSRRGLEENNVGHTIPCIRIQAKRFSICLRVERAEFGEGAVAKGGAARATCEGQR